MSNSQGEPSSGGVCRSVHESERIFEDDALGLPVKIVSQALRS